MSEKTLVIPHIEIKNIGQIKKSVEAGNPTTIFEEQHDEGIIDTAKVVAERKMHYQAERLLLVAHFAVCSSVDTPTVARLKESSTTALHSADIDTVDMKRIQGRYGILLTHLTETEQGDTASLYYSQKKRPPGFVLSNDKREDKDLCAKSPVYNGECFEEKITAFMELFGLAYQALGYIKQPPRYEVGFLGKFEPRTTPKSADQPPNTRRAKKTWKRHSGNAAKPKTEVEQAKFLPRLPNPNAKLDDVRGVPRDSLAKIKQRLLTFKEPELAKRYRVDAAGGILLYGPPGTGKTMLAAAVSNEIEGATFWQIDASDLIEKWVGNSARNTKNVFLEAAEVAKKKPVILFFDEIDASIGNKEDTSSERGAALGEFKRSLGHIAEQEPNILVVATTNHPDRLDDAFIRQGRFDIQAYMPLPDDKARTLILLDNIDLETVLPEGMSMDADNGDLIEERLFESTNRFNFDRLAKETAGMSGADIGNIIKSCRLEKFEQHVIEGKYPGPITEADIIEQIRIFRES